MEKIKVYPSWRYHKELEPRIVQDEAADKLLGSDWKDTPAAFEDVVPAKAEPAKKEIVEESKEQIPVIKRVKVKRVISDGQ